MRLSQLLALVEMNDADPFLVDVEIYYAGRKVQLNARELTANPSGSHATLKLYTDV